MTECESCGAIGGYLEELGMLEPTIQKSEWRVRVECGICGHTFEVPKEEWRA